MEDNVNQIVQRLKEVILSSGYTYAELEKLTGISRSSLQRYANGITTKIPIDAIQAIANAVGVDAKYIMGWTSESQTKAPEESIPPHSEQKILLLARHLEKIPEEKRQRIIKNFEDTIDTYLDAMGINKED